MIQQFNFHGSDMRITDKDGSPWFVLKDVARILGIRNHNEVATRMPDDEKGVANVYPSKNKQAATIISEPGLYRLIFQSRKAQAEAFKKWVITEVLPAIRKTGKYEMLKGVSIEDSKKQRNTFTDVLKDHGYTKPGHYISTTRNMKAGLGIDPGKKKDTLDFQERGAVFFAELLAANTIHASDATGYQAVNPIAVNAAESVKALIEHSKRPMLGASA